MDIEKRLNVSRLIRDLGGARAVAEAIGQVRTAPYRWIARNYIGSPTLEQIKTAFPIIDLNQYFEDTLVSDTPEENT